MLYSKFSFSSVQFSHSVVSDSSLPHGLQHARLPCPSPASGACSNSCPSSWWCQLRFSLVIYFTVVYICQSQSPSLSHPIFSPLYPYGSSLHLCLYFCLANKSICIIFLDSTYKWYYMIFGFPKREIIKESRISRQCLCEYLSQAVLEIQT